MGAPFVQKSSARKNFFGALSRSAPFWQAWHIVEHTKFSAVRQFRGGCFMSRMRQIPVTEVTQHERMVSQTMSQPVMRPTANNFRMRSRKNAVNKFRLSDTPALLSNGCSSVREFCNNVQNITADLNHLIGSVENILPLLTTYLAAIQARNLSAEQPSAMEPPIEVSAPEHPVQQPQPAAQQQTQAAPMPRPEDIQQLLENPLVKNLLTSFMQNVPH